MSNKILIIAMNKDWIGISRLPSGLSRAGFTTYALCPIGSYLSYTKYLSSTIQFPFFTYTRSKIIYLFVLYAVFKYRPDRIIPGDEEAILVLQRMSSFFSKIPFANKLVSLFRSSLPSKDFDTMIFSKSTFVENCEKWGVPVPKNREVTTSLEAKVAALEMGYPVVLKLDAGYGGSGVFICEGEEDLMKSFSSNQNPSLVTRFKFFIKNLFFISIIDKELKISIQQYVKGIAGHVSFCALNGKLLAANPMLGIRTYPGSKGPSSVSQGFNNSLLIESARTVANKISYNGFGSLDFMFDEKNNRVYIIELNSRPTPPCHFSAEVVTNDLCSFLFKALNHQQIIENSFKPFTVAMFPNEKNRDPNSHFLNEAFHDIPLDDPELLMALSLQAKYS
jgi:predicted ATP-grasp superfamily ATP-dependent carboligase